MGLPERQWHGTTPSGGAGFGAALAEEPLALDYLLGGAFPWLV